MVDRPLAIVGGVVDARTDIYAFGIILYETIAGRPPFDGDTLIQLLHEQMNEPPPPLTTLVARLDSELRALVEKCLEKEPLNRPQSMHEVRAELVRLRELALTERKPLYGDVMPKVATPAKRRKKKASGSPALICGGLAVLLAGGLGAWKVLTPAPPPPAAVVVSPTVPVAPVAPPTGPKPGRLMVSTNAMATRVYLDKSETERSKDPVAAGGNNLRITVPPDTDWVLRIEANGFKSLSMPFKIGNGEEQALPVVLTPDAPPPTGKKPGHTGVKPPVSPTEAPKPKPTDNGKFLDPFEK